MIPTLTLLASMASLVALGLMAGAVLYTSLVEIPVRQDLNPDGQLNNWQLVFPVASGFLKPFGVALFPLVVISGFLTGQFFWFIAAAFLISLVPVTAIFIAKTNAKLLAREAGGSPKETVALIKGWDRLHHLRTAIVLAAFLAALIALYLTIQGLAP